MTVKMMTDFSLDEFKADCENYFKQYDSEQSIIDSLNKFNSTYDEFKEIDEENFGKSEEKPIIWTSMSEVNLNVFNSWYSSVLYGSEKDQYTLIRNWIKMVRKNANYDCRLDLDSEDPLNQKNNKDLLNQYKDIYYDTVDAFSQKECIDQKFKELAAIKEEKSYQDSLNICVEGQDYKAIKICNVLWSGWECDNHAWVIDTGKEKKLVATNHGSPSFVAAEFLEGKIKEYEDAIIQSKEMLKLLNS